MVPVEMANVIVSKDMVDLIVQVKIEILNLDKQGMQKNLFILLNRMEMHHCCRLFE